jgi:S1-C subfamily serine protease
MGSIMDGEKKEHDIIDDDLYEDFTEEELIQLVEEARIEALEKARVRRKMEEPTTGKHFPKWVIWLIALALFFNLIALLPQTFSIPAIEFLKVSTTLSAQDDIKVYKEAVVVIETGESKGTGFAYDPTGKILTNYHVVEGHDEVTVAFPKKALFQGKVTETFPEIDLAIIDVEATGLPYLELAQTYDYLPNEEVYFIGNPLQFSGIANQGSVLSFVDVKSKELPVVMMDAPIYRGNSGSPVINGSGQVIGVVFATMNHEEEGRVGLFIPIDYFYQYNG